MENAEEYQVNLDWQENKKALLTSVIFNNTIEVAPYSCLKKIDEDVWSSEHLFIASIESSYMTAFFRAAKNKGIIFKSFKSTARASILISDEFSEITDIVIRPTVIISESNHINKILKLFSVCKDQGLVLNALKVRLHIFPSVCVG
ncbi:hypothetical protein IRZ83_13285 [Flavobacterium sp. JLP]|uniref:hypothetical protein n=1 Tax=unclassified Flavobacterium TaxID=196869 RepID=UPI00188AC2F1|nr:MULTISPECIES: hypothetical protein [unclassified Flavobacterium]MBF4494255.1 hypothetical protein [Flavobacterium sp. MR2016-29]MBF4507643.1 hypothetical protein [Flavobacterium sp. JLP]